MNQTTAEGDGRTGGTRAFLPGTSAKHPAEDGGEGRLASARRVRASSSSARSFSACTFSCARSSSIFFAFSRAA